TYALALPLAKSHVVTRTRPVRAARRHRLQRLGRLQPGYCAGARGDGAQAAAALRVDDAVEADRDLALGIAESEPPALDPAVPKSPRVGGPAWAEWQAVHWRTRAGYRRAEHPRVLRGGKARHEHGGRQRNEPTTWPREKPQALQPIIHRTATPCPVRAGD